MRRSRKPKKTDFQKKQDKAVAIRKLIDNERDRHGRKLKTLAEQVSAAQRFKSDDLKALALVRLEGQREDELAKHKERRRALEARLQTALR